jgi:hypothetical protein
VRIPALELWEGMLTGNARAMIRSLPAVMRVLRYAFPTGPDGEGEPFCRLRTDHQGGVLLPEQRRQIALGGLWVTSTAFLLKIDGQRSAPNDQAHNPDPQIACPCVCKGEDAISGHAQTEGSCH